MIDITTNQYEKDLFITGVLLGVDNNKMLVQYADGSERMENFSIHNYNAILLQMEEQYLKYKDNFIKKMMTAKLNVLFNSITNLIMDLCILYFSFNFDNALKIILPLFTLIFGGSYQISNYLRLKKVDSYIEFISLVDEFLNNKSNYKVDVVNPVNGEREDWYLLNMSNIESVGNRRNLKHLNNNMTDEFKNEQGKLFTKKFKCDYKKNCGD